MKRSFLGLGIAAALILAGCPQDQRNAFLTLTEELGATASGIDGGTGGGSGGTGGSGSTVTFRQTMNVTLMNINPTAELNVSLAAWVNTSSIRSAAQQDALIAGGYVQLTREVSIGTAFTLPPGTFVLNGSGLAGAQLHTLARAALAGEVITPVEEQITLITPDVVLLFLAPPTSCESPAYVFTEEGFPIDALITFADGITAGIAAYAGSNSFLGVKTLAQIGGYQCSPLQPGIFRKIGGGARKDNEFFEGEDVRAIFGVFPDANGNTAAILFE